MNTIYQNIIMLCKRGETGNGMGSDFVRDIWLVDKTGDSECETGYWSTECA